MVPTWNYVTVHAAGPADFFDDPERLHDLVSRLTDQREVGRAAPWAVSDAPETFVASQLRGIVGVALRIETIQGKWKLSQNRNEADRAGVVAGLAAEPGPQAAAIAEGVAAIW